jgi:hypothetical protein
MNNGKCAECWHTLYYEECEDYDEEYCQIFTEKPWDEAIREWNRTRGV